VSTATPGRRNPDRRPSLTEREILVPGSTSNLGPGFDTLGLALRLYLRVRITGVEDDGRGRTAWDFGDAPPAGSNSIERGYRAGLREFLPRDTRLPSLALEARSEIPIRAGLGSSAAALVAGLRLAALVAGQPPAGRLLAAAAALEGHPDNTSASVLGGFVVASRQQHGEVVARALPWPEGWPLVVATPALALRTAVARAALPAAVPLADAVFNVQRVALLVAAVHAGDPVAARAAFGDRLHQPARAALVPGLASALDWSDPGLLGVFLSGAGPSIAAVVDAEVKGAAEAARDRFERLYAGLHLDASVRVLHAHPPHAPE
jgi:homoserine kinase